MGDIERTTTGVERKWHEVYVKSFEKKLASYLCNVKLRRFMKNLLPQEIEKKEISCILSCHFIL